MKSTAAVNSAPLVERRGVARYTWWDVTAQPSRVAAELEELLELPWRVA